uniref:Small ribosomal subunit protein uS2c n=1 Tax=Discoplastis spathirhyncha TaxID=215771 RepID=A0A3G3LLA4_9EUGL|nr:ribosomal protein S2 [Discoplastis spathirhyncha]AYQ93488.1 ribosomal protein S2 [Discoplastis spathirhyncha]
MITLEQMLNSSVHLGHQVQKWNPKMAPYIYGERNGIHVIDLLQTSICLEKACRFLVNISKENKEILFVGTKRQFSSIIQLCAINSGSHYINYKWLGGMLTNWLTIKTCINSLQIFSKQEVDGASISSLTKKETMLLKKRRVKLEKYLIGVINMKKVPDVVIIIGQNREMNAVKECLKLKIPIISILDTNCDPTLADFIIPGNDDSVSSVSLILNELSKVITLNKNFIV